MQPQPTMRSVLFCLFCLFCSTLAVFTTMATATAAERQAENYSPLPQRHFPEQVYWGDTHVHTALSGDAFLRETRLGPDAAYRFARGEVVTSNTGQPVRLRRPLDFIVVADHANNAGAAYARDRFNNENEFRETDLGRLWQQARDLLRDNPDTDPEALAHGPLLPTHRPGQISARLPEFRRHIWHDITEAADRYYDPGHFTTFIGYEWTPLRGAVHRVVIFEDDAAKTNRILPFTSFDSANAEELWAFMESYERNIGGSVLAIPHNGNLTYGLMFALEDSYGKPLDADYSRRRARWEPLVEVTQIKGDGETHPYLSPDDAFADFETWNGWSGPAANQRGEDKIQFEYARSALKLGLALQAQFDVNPYQFGMIGSSDSHTALAAVAEDNFWGKGAISEPSPTRMFNGPAAFNRQASAAGYAAVWAQENTREAIFAAMRRRETYASTGPRMVLRFFGGWSFTAADAHAPDLAALGYSSGVPMGGELRFSGPDQRPGFLIRAARDPSGANLDRIQVVKGWHTSAGEQLEKVYNVVWADSGNRQADQRGQIPEVGSTVDLERASYSNSIGASELSAFWRDPDFDPGQPAFYYARVLEIPTPRWTTYDAVRFGVDRPEDVAATLQERAYSSPVWYTP